VRHGVTGPAVGRNCQISSALDRSVPLSGLLRRRTRHLGWGTDTHLYRAAATLHEEFPRKLRLAGPRVLKQNRGNGGQGLWRVELISTPAQGAPIVRVLQASRGSVPEDLPLDDFTTRCEAYFADDGCIIDQPFQPGLPDGMIRC
jgi:hypothetical protein